MAHDMLHVISAQCVASDLHTIVPGPLSVADSSQHSEEILKIKSCTFVCDFFFFFFFFLVFKIIFIT